MTRKKRNSKSNFFKQLFQFGILFILAYLGIRLIFDKTFTTDFEAYCPFGGLQALGSYLSRGSLACTMTGTQIIMGLLLAAGAMLFGKLFCGYICPIGTVSELIGKLGDRLKIRFTITGLADKLLRSLKYVLLFITFYFTLTSSELFCKTFDPYYALASGFNSDVVVLYAILTLTILLVGSLFVRLLWCKYLCPLGAISNIFRFFWFFLAAMGVYALLLVLDVNIHWVWPLGVVSVGGYILEIWKMKKVALSPVNITRSLDSCINCNICSKKCPQGIDVANMVKVTHIDCNLCGDCLTHCPEKNTLQINRKSWNWLPAAVLAILLIIGFSLKSVWEIPTIDEKWGTPEEIEQSAVFSQSGLKNIKCFGSSAAFSAQMQKVKGVYGVATYVKRHEVKVWYNPAMLNDSMLQKIIFTPVKKIFKPVKREVGEILKVNVSLENFFDPMDAYYLQQLLLKYTNAVALQTEYSCPVLVSIYFPGDTSLDLTRLVSLLESKTLSYTINEIEHNVNLNYLVISGPKTDTLLIDVYGREMYVPTQSRFNDYSSYRPDELSTLRVPMGDNKEFKDDLNFLISHISGEEGILGLYTSLDDSGSEWLEIAYLDSLIEKAKVLEQINSDSLYFVFRDGTEGVKANPFVFREELPTPDF